MQISRKKTAKPEIYHSLTSATIIRDQHLPKENLYKIMKNSSYESKPNVFVMNAKLVSNVPYSFNVTGNILHVTDNVTIYAQGFIF